VTAADPVPSPKLVIAGDSITEYLMADYAVGTWAWQVARRLNLADRFVPYGTAGRGWLMSTPFSLDVAGIIAEAPDFLVIALGTNDALGSVDPATLTATVTARLNEIRAALPAVRIVVAGPLPGMAPEPPPPRLPQASRPPMPAMAALHRFSRARGLFGNQPLGLRRQHGLDHRRSPQPGRARRDRRGAHPAGRSRAQGNGADCVSRAWAGATRFRKKGYRRGQGPCTP
jgi:lysophospholipase L1-like esterase